MLNTDDKGGSAIEADDEGFYGSCCLGDYAEMNGKSMFEIAESNAVNLNDMVKDN